MARGNFGERLKRERELREVTPNEIVVATRISLRFLDALENEDWDKLPGGIFNRGFVRAIARYLGLDEENLLAEYDLAHGDQSADIPLQPFDRLSIKQVTGWTEQDQVSLKGEVRFPGSYSIQPGETLHSVINRAGGFTQFAFVQGSVFTRRELKMREQEQLDRLAARMRTEIAEVALMGVRGQQGSAASAISIGETLLHQLTETKAVGRLVVDLKDVMHSNPGSRDDVILRDGDELIVPKQRQEPRPLSRHPHRSPQPRSGWAQSAPR